MVFHLVRLVFFLVLVALVLLLVPGLVSVILCPGVYTISTRTIGGRPVRQCLCHVFSLPSCPRHRLCHAFSLPFVPKTPPLPLRLHCLRAQDTAFALCFDCLRSQDTAFALCVSTAFMTKTSMPPFPCVFPLRPSRRCSPAAPKR